MSAYIAANQASQKQFFAQLKKYYGFYTIGFLAFLVALAIAEQMGMSRKWIGYWFLFATIALYAGIGIMSRTVDAAEYYVAGRRVPAFFNGMATGADWMSAASFIGMAGTLYLSGFDGLSFVTFGQVVVSQINHSSGVPLGIDGNQRHERSDNYDIQARRTSALLTE